MEDEMPFDSVNDSPPTMRAFVLGPDLPPIVR